MCGRYSLATPAPADLRGRFPLGESLELRRRFNIAPGDEVACVTTTREGEPRGELLRWGLVPHWADSPANAFKMINARAETVAERPAYREAFERRRCLVVADGFYEWQPRPGRPKQPWWITRSDGAPFAFAAIRATWHDEHGQQLRTCSIITTAANGVLAGIHDRMPVILTGAEAEATWLEHATPRPVLAELMAPLADDLTRPHAVGTAVNDARYDGPECLAAPEPEPETLF